MTAPPAYRSCTDPDCSLGASRVVLRRSVASATRLVRAAGFDLTVLRITRRERFITLMARKVEHGHDPDRRQRAADPIPA